MSLVFALMLDRRFGSDSRTLSAGYRIRIFVEIVFAAGHVHTGYLSLLMLRLRLSMPNRLCFSPELKGL